MLLRLHPFILLPTTMLLFLSMNMNIQWSLPLCLHQYKFLRHLTAFHLSLNCLSSPFCLVPAMHTIVSYTLTSQFSQCDQHFPTLLFLLKQPLPREFYFSFETVLKCCCNCLLILCPKYTHLLSLGSQNNVYFLMIPIVVCFAQIFHCIKQVLKASLALIGRNLASSS